MNLNHAPAWPLTLLQPEMLKSSSWQPGSRNPPHERSPLMSEIVQKPLWCSRLAYTNRWQHCKKAWSSQANDEFIHRIHRSDRSVVKSYRLARSSRHWAQPLSYLSVRSHGWALSPSHINEQTLTWISRKSILDTAFQAVGLVLPASNRGEFSWVVSKCCEHSSQRHMHRRAIISHVAAVASLWAAAAFAIQQTICWVHLANRPTCLAMRSIIPLNLQFCSWWRTPIAIISYHERIALARENL